MTSIRSNDPLHGVTLERLLTELVAHFGWEELGEQIEIRCFRFDPSIKSSLVFLRKTPWARTQVEQLYVRWKTGDWSGTSKPDPSEDLTTKNTKITKDPSLGART